MYNFYGIYVPRALWKSSQESFSFFSAQQNSKKCKKNSRNPNRGKFRRLMFHKKYNKHVKSKTRKHNQKEFLFSCSWKTHNTLGLLNSSVKFYYDDENITIQSISIKERNKMEKKFQFTYFRVLNIRKAKKAFLHHFCLFILGKIEQKDFFPFLVYYIRIVEHKISIIFFYEKFYVLHWIFSILFFPSFVSFSLLRKWKKGIFSQDLHICWMEPSMENFS